MKTKDKVELDKLLIELCTTGHKESWRKLFSLYQPLVLRQISLWLRPRLCAELVEEIAGRMWVKLIEKQFARLANFDTDRGVKLSTYLVALAKNEFLMFLREEKRRLRRESLRAHSLSACMSEEFCGIEVEEILSNLGTVEEVANDKQTPVSSSDSEIYDTGDILRRTNRKLLRKLLQQLDLNNNHLLSCKNLKRQRKQKKPDNDSVGGI